MGKLIPKTWIWMILIVLVSPKALALALTPAGHTINFEPGKVVQSDFEVYAPKGSELSLIVTGDLLDYFNLSSDVVRFDNSTKQVVNFSISFPEVLEEGTYHIDIKVVPKFKSYKKGGVNIYPSLIHNIRIFVPYSHKKIEIENLEIKNPRIKEVTTFIASVKNVGEKTIDSVKGIVEIYDADGKKVTELETNEVKGFESTKRALLETKWIPDVSAGKYLAKVKVDYDKFKKERAAEFTIGELIIKVLDISSKNFKLGKVVPLSILLQSNWNQKIDDVYCAVTISKDGYAETFETNKVDIEPGAISEVVGNWDTSKATPGRYKIFVVVHAIDQTFEKVFEIKVKDHELSLLKQLTGSYSEVAEDKETNVVTVISYGIILLIVALNIIWYLVQVRRRKLLK